MDGSTPVSASNCALVRVMEDLAELAELDWGWDVAAKPAAAAGWVAGWVSGTAGCADMSRCGERCGWLSGGMEADGGEEGEDMMIRVREREKNTPNERTCSSPLGGCRWQMPAVWVAITCLSTEH